MQKCHISQLDTSCKMHIHFQSSTTNTCTFTQLWQSIVVISSRLTIINQAFYTTTFPSIMNIFSNTSNAPFIKYSTSNLKHSIGGFHVMKQSKNLVVHSNRNMSQMGQEKKCLCIKLIGDFNEGMGTLTHIKLLNGKTMTKFKWWTTNL